MAFCKMAAGCTGCAESPSARVVLLKQAYAAATLGGHGQGLHVIVSCCLGRDSLSYGQHCAGPTVAHVHCNITLPTSKQLTVLTLCLYPVLRLAPIRYTALLLALLVLICSYIRCVSDNEFEHPSPAGLVWLNSIHCVQQRSCSP